MKPYLIFFVLVFSISSDFPKDGYDRVVLYRIEMDEQSGIWSLFDAQGNLTSKDKGLDVNAESITELVRIVNDTSTYGAAHSYSHSPTLGLVFYKKSKIIDWLEIALPTNSISSNSEIKNKWKYFEFIYNDFEYPLTGLSPHGRQRLRQWIKESGMKEEGYQSTWDSTQIDYTKLKRKF